MSDLENFQWNHIVEKPITLKEIEDWLESIDHVHKRIIEHKEHSWPLFCIRDANKVKYLIDIIEGQRESFKKLKKLTLEKGLPNSVLIIIERALKLTTNEGEGTMIVWKEWEIKNRVLIRFNPLNWTIGIYIGDGFCVVWLQLLCIEICFNCRRDESIYGE